MDRQQKSRTAEEVFKEDEERLAAKIKSETEEYHAKCIEWQYADIEHRLRMLPGLEYVQAHNPEYWKAEIVEFRNLNKPAPIDFIMPPKKDKPKKEVKDASKTNGGNTKSVLQGEAAKNSTREPERQRSRVANKPPKPDNGTAGGYVPGLFG